MNTPARLTVFVFGEAENAREAGSEPICIVPVAEEWSHGAQPERLNELLAGADTEFVAFARAEHTPKPEKFAKQVETLSRVADSAVCLRRMDTDAFDDWKRWTGYPDALAALLRDPDPSQTGVFRSRAFSDVGAFVQETDTVWEWIVRAMDQGFAVSICDEVLASGAHPATERLPTLTPAAPDARRNWLRDAIASFDVGPVSDAGRLALTAGLFQINDFLDESHRCSQRIEGEPLGDHWHAIIHRREPDYGNSQYWYRRVGRSSLFVELASQASQILDSCNSPDARAWQDRLGVSHNWDAIAFVDLCRDCTTSADAELVTAARKIQDAEMRLLFEQTWCELSGEVHQ